MNDLIRKQTVLNMLDTEQFENQLYTQTERELLARIWFAVNAIPFAQQWIPCFERLPEEDGLEVLFSSRFGRVHIGKYHDDASLNRWFSYRDKIRLMNDEVTAWMPSPEPYKGDDK